MEDMTWEIENQEIEENQEQLSSNYNSESEWDYNSEDYNSNWLSEEQEYEDSEWWSEDYWTSNDNDELNSN